MTIYVDKVDGMDISSETKSSLVEFVKLFEDEIKYIRIEKIASKNRGKNFIALIIFL